MPVKKDFYESIILFDFPGPRLRSTTVRCINIITLFALDNKQESALLENQSSSTNTHKQQFMWRWAPRQKNAAKSLFTSRWLQLLIC